MKKAYLLIVLILCGLSVGNLFASASAAAATKAEGELDLELRGLIQDAAEAGDSQEVARLLALASAAEGNLGEELRKAGIGKEEEDVGNLFASASAAAAAAEEAAAVALGQELINAAREGNKPEVEELIALEIDVNAADQYGATALMRAAEEGYEYIVEALLQARGIDVNAANIHDGETALMWAVRAGREDIVRTLWQAGADVNAATPDGYTALMLAARDGDEDIVKTLLQVDRINVNAIDWDGYTALMVAAVNDHEKIVKMLLDEGADKTIQTKLGRTAEDLARANDNKKLADIIKDYGLGRLTKSAGKIVLLTVKKAELMRS